MFKNQNILKICLLNYINTNKKQTTSTKKNHKRILDTVQFLHGAYVKSIVRNIYQNSQSFQKINAPQTVQNFMVIGYFKLTQIINNSQPTLPIITLGVTAELYNFLNLYIKDNTSVELKYIHDTNNIIKKQSETISNFQNKWQSFGIICQKTSSETKFVYSNSNSMLQLSTVISAAPLPATISSLNICISCSIEGGNFGKFNGYYSTVKVLNNIDFNQVDLYSLFNEAITITKSPILSNTFNQNSYVQNSEYDVGQGFTCNSGYAFFEGACIQNFNCKVIIFENNIYSSFESGKFFDNTLNKCLNCGSNCSQCTSNTVCTQCRPGYNIIQDRCVRCEASNSCNSSCIGQQVFDPINQICIDSFSTTSQSLQNPLISSRIINDNSDIDVIPTFSQINDIIILCYLDIDINPMTLLSFLGGPQFTSSTILKKQWNNVPKGYQKSVSFYVLFYDIGSPSNLQVKINSNIATLDNNFETLQKYKISCSGSNSQIQSVFKVMFSIKDFETFFNLEIQSNRTGWGVRNINIEILKCHPACNSCKLEGECTSCKVGMVLNKFQCTCPEGQYAKYQNCFDSPCVVCQTCSVTNCQKCEDITGNCTQCRTGYSIKDGQCVQDSSCTQKDSQYFNYCGVQLEDAFIHFNQNKIVQYGDYWKFYNNDVQALYISSLNKSFLPAIGLNHQHTITMTLPNFQSYHFQINFKIQILVQQNEQDFDIVKIQESDYAIFTNSYNSQSSLSVNEQGQFLKSNNQLFLRFIAQTDKVQNSEGFSFTQLEFSYKRCHPMCTSCTDEHLVSCTNCINNASKTPNICQCNEGFYFVLVRYQTYNVPPGSCLKCNSACKTCTGPSYQDCILCQDGYTQTNNICQFQCQEGFYWNQTSFSCLNCHPCCRTCESSSIDDCHDCKQGYTLRAQDKTCMIYNAQCQACTVAVNSLCGGTQSNHDTCLSSSWVVKDANTCVNCSKYVNSQCGGDQTLEVIDICQQQEYFNYDSNNCSSCRFVVFNNCGKSEIKDQCHSNGWAIMNASNCVNCSKFVNNKCGGDQTQEVVEVCKVQGFFNYNSSNCSSCTDVVSNYCGRNEIKNQCYINSWVVMDAKKCVKCSQFANNNCGGDQSQQVIDICKKQGFFNFDNNNCSSCRDVLSNDCGRSEINNSCHSNGWAVKDAITCVNCSKFTNNKCGGDQQQDVIDACQNQEFFNYDSNNCSSCREVVSNYCGRSEIKDKCHNNGWAVKDANICVRCNKFVNNKCGGDQSQEVMDSCKKQGYFNYDSNNCSSCRDVNSNDCGRDEIKVQCFDDGWDKFENKNCKDCKVNSPTFNECICDSTCSGCSRYFNPKSCKACQPSLYLFKNQCLSKCPNGHKINGTNCMECQDEQMSSCVSCFKSCLICDPLKLNTNSNSCTQCSSLTRKYDNGQCLCQDEEDQRELLYECSYQNVAVLNAVLSNSDPVLIIDFGKVLKIPDGFSHNENPCKYLFTDQTIQLLGSEPDCKIQVKAVVVTLGKNAQVIEGDFINLKINTLSYNKIPEIKINKYMNTIVVQDKIIGNTKVQFDYVSIENSCNDINISFNQILNDAKRGFQKYHWSLKKFVPENPVLQSALEKVIQNSNFELSLNLLIPKGIVKLGSKVKITFSYTLKAGPVSFEDITLAVKPEKKLFIDFQTSNIFPMVRYQNGFVIISPVVRQCDPIGDIIIKEPIDLTISSIQFPNINYSNSIFDKQDYTLELKPYSYPAQKIILNAKAKLVSNTFIEAKADFEINVVQSDLFVKIIGGNGYFSHKKEVIIEGKVRDLDIENENEPQGIKIKWECIDPSTSLYCVSKDGIPVTFSSEYLFAKIEPFTFIPYTTVKVQLKGDKPIYRSSASSVIILLSELDLPPLGVQLQVKDVQSSTINLNEEIFVIINYSTSVNVDLLSFSGTIQYENEVVGIIKFDYTSLRFQIWNYKSDFNRNSPDFQIRFNVFNPQYYMPSMFMSTLTINFPPKNCKFTVTPTSGGFSLDTRFLIQFDECEDENKPIQYQFFFYRNSNDFEYEKKYPLQVQRRQITDKQSNQMVETSLPSGQILILGQAIDSKNAIYNNTVAITVNRQQYDEQTYIKIIEQKLDLVNQLSSGNAISELSILSDDILHRQELKLSSQLNNKKISIVNQLNILQQNLSPLSTFATIVDKSTKSLIESGITYNQSQKTDLLNQLITTLDESANIKESTLELSKEKLKQKIFDSYSVINAMGNLKSDTESGQKYLELTNKIGQNLFKNILPNEDPIHFNGDNLSIFGTQMTEKYICSYFFCESQIPTDEKKQSKIYNFKKSQYNQNPYSNDASFIEFLEKFKKTNENLKIDSYPIVTPTINSLENNSGTQFSKKVILSFPNKLPTTNQKNMTCLIKSNGIKWTNSGCSNMYNKESNTYSCVCEGLSPTTIIDDLENLFENSNIKTAFSEDGLSNISHFDEFYKYGATWVLLSETILFIILYKKGVLLDDFSNKKKCTSSTKVQSHQQTSKNKVAPLNDEQQDKVSIQLKQEQNVILEEDLDDYGTSNRRSMAENQINKEDVKSLCKSNNIDTQQNDIEQGKFQSDNNSPFIGFAQIYDENSLLKNPSERQTPLSQPKTSQKNNISPQTLQLNQNKDKLNLAEVSKPKKRRKSDKSLMSQSNQKMLNHKIESQANTKTNIIDQNIKQTVEQISKQQINQDVKQIQICQVAFQNLPMTKKVLIFHNFFGIFYIYNPEVPRALRFLIFYIRSIHSIGISVVFDKKYSIVQKVAISVISSVIMIIVVKLFGKFFTYKSKIGIALSRILILTVLITYYYIILSIISGETPEQSNTFFEAFALFFCIDIFVVSTISAFCQKYIAKYIFKKQELTGIIKHLFKLIELQLILLQLQ